MAGLVVLPRQVAGCHPAGEAHQGLVEDEGGRHHLVVPSALLNIRRPSVGRRAILLVSHRVGIERGTADLELHCCHLVTEFNKIVTDAQE